MPEVRSLRLTWVLLLVVHGACDTGQKGLVGTNDEEAMALVAEGSFAPYPEDMIGSAADCYFDSTAWASFLGQDGFTYVNLEGYGIGGADGEALLQFRVFRGDATFTLSAMELDGITQPDSAVLSLVDDMIACEPTP